MAMASNSPAALGNLVRLIPLSLNELPAHSSIPKAPIKDGIGNETGRPRPDLLTFLHAILDEGGAFLDKSTFPSTFTPQGSKSSPPSTSPVQVLKRDIPLAEIERISWDSSPIPRRKPRALGAEHWFARRSRHPNVSSKEKKGSASWDEFVFGLRDEHSKHECDFTPTLYDAHHILDWNEEVLVLKKEGKLRPYSHATMSSESHISTCESMATNFHHSIRNVSYHPSTSPATLLPRPGVHSSHVRDVLPSRHHPGRS